MSDKPTTTTGDMTESSGVAVGTNASAVHAPVDTNADVAGSAVLGTNSGAVANTNAAGGTGGTVYVNIGAERRAEQLEPPEGVPRALQEVWKQITAANFRIDDLAVLTTRTYESDRQDRLIRQQEADLYRQTVLAEQAATRRWLYALSVFVIILVATQLAVFVVLWQIVNRLGWLLGGG